MPRNDFHLDYAYELSELFLVSRFAEHEDWLTEAVADGGVDGHGETIVIVDVGIGLVRQRPRASGYHLRMKCGLIHVDQGVLLGDDVAQQDGEVFAVLDVAK